MTREQSKIEAPYDFGIYWKDLVGNTKDRLANWKVGGPNYTPIRLNLGAPQFITPLLN